MKKTYQAPTAVVLGSVRELTRGLTVVGSAKGEVPYDWD